MGVIEYLKGLYSVYDRMYSLCAVCKPQRLLFCVFLLRFCPTLLNSIFCQSPLSSMFLFKPISSWYLSVFVFIHLHQIVVPKHKRVPLSIPIQKILKTSK